MKQRLSLKGRGLQLLAQREHSRVELRRKLLAHARAELADVVRAAQVRSCGDADRDPSRRGLQDALSLDDKDAFIGVQHVPDDDPGALGPEHEADPPTAVTAEVDAVLDWLQAHRYLCEERFVESRVHARIARFGSLRIRQELAQHGLELSPLAAESLRSGELARAREVWKKKFAGRLPPDAAERGRQMRFLLGRGFCSEVIRRVLRGDDD